MVGLSSAGPAMDMVSRATTPVPAAPPPPIPPHLIRHRASAGHDRLNILAMLCRGGVHAHLLIQQHVAIACRHRGPPNVIRVPPIRHRGPHPIRVPPIRHCGPPAPICVAPRTHHGHPRATHPARRVPFFQERTPTLTVWGEII